MMKYAIGSVGVVLADYLLKEVILVRLETKSDSSGFFDSSL
jgi:hypothetical protein